MAFGRSICSATDFAAPGAAALTKAEIQVLSSAAKNLRFRAKKQKYVASLFIDARSFR
jgi:hypothetical protein